jgi:5-formyltetrahydrofolate cyclo-ligase
MLHPWALITILIILVVYEVKMDKQSLRKKYLEIRNNISNKDAKSNIIFNQIINLKEYQNAQIIAIYKNLKSEVNTNKLIDYSLSIGKTIALPKVTNDDMKFYKIENNSELLKSNFGVLEPIANNDNYISKDNIDVIIVPGICFDKNKNRLGFGKGYYDRYLLNTKIKKIGICFNEQIIDIVPTSKYDIKMDLIITDREII